MYHLHYYALFQIDEELAKLLEFKKLLGDDGTKKFTLKCPKVSFCDF